MNALLAGLGFLIWISLVIYVLVLATRLVKAVEKIADNYKD